MSTVTPLLFLALSVAGGIGAALRLVVDGLVKARAKTLPTLGTAIINVSGSLLLGLLTGMATSNVAYSTLALVAGTGLLGGYTTFSTASFETVRLLQGRRWAAGFVTGFGVLALAVAASMLGLLLGMALAK